MNWDAINKNEDTKKVLRHWQKLGQFRANHMAVGAGKHQLISDKNGLVFSRILKEDKLVIAINLLEKDIDINVSTVFKNGQKLRDFYSDQEVEVRGGKVKLTSIYRIVLLEKI
jgi:alpha-amylase